MIGQLHKLSLVYPPVSNQVAEWIKNDPEVQEIIHESNIYFIAQRPEMYFIFDQKSIERLAIERKIEGSLISNDYNSKFWIDVNGIIEYYKDEIKSIDNVNIEVGEKIIKIKNCDDILTWFTVEKLLFDRSRNLSIIHGLDDYRLFNKYFLHYVGISKEDDSLRRLVIKPHDKRIRILSNEYPFSKGSRPSDEITFFFFKLSTLEAHVLEDGKVDDFVDRMGKITGTMIERIADAEKALISVLDTKYNTMKYSDYPKSIDGLYSYEINQYAYFIGESYSFITESNTIVGNWTDDDFDKDNIADFIAIADNTVTLYKA